MKNISGHTFIELLLALSIGLMVLAFATFIFLTAVEKLHQHVIYHHIGATKRILAELVLENFHHYDVEITGTDLMIAIQYVDPITKTLFKKIWQIKKTARFDDKNHPIYALYENQREMIDHVNEMHLLYSIKQNNSVDEVPFDYMTDWHKVIGIEFNFVLAGNQSLQIYCATRSHHEK